ncbi:MAG: class I SAM-dependent methyltransferase [Pseudomonadota bacterium]
MTQENHIAGAYPGWLETPMGQALLGCERDQLRQALEGVFGEHLLQIGRWGSAEGFIDLSRTQHAVTVYTAEQGVAAGVYADFARLPFDSNSVDAVLLPHTLDMAVSPHDVLREVHRVLRSDGRLLMLGFKPFGLWGMRRLFSRGSFPSGINHALGERTLRDWLQLLDLRVENHQRFFFRPPFDRFATGGNEKLAHTAQRWFPELAACYLLQARKRVAAITPIRPRWHRRARVVGGVTKPSLRNVVKMVHAPDSEDSDNG